MTIEATLQSIDASLKAILVIAQTGATVSAEVGTLTETAAAAAQAANKRGPGRPKKDDAAAAGSAEPKDLVEGDPEGTTYYVIQKHKTVARVLPGESAPSIEGQQQIGGAKYLEWKETYAKLSATAQAGTTTTTASEPDFKAVTEALIKLTKTEGQGRPALDKLMAEYGVTKVPLLEAKNKNAEIMAKVNALLNPPAAAGAEDDDPFAS